MIKVFLVLFLLFYSLIAKKDVNVYVNMHFSKEVALKRWTPTIDLLNKELPQYNFKLLPIKPTDVGEIQKLLDEKKIDFLITQAAIYSKLKYSNGINRFLTMSNEFGMSRYGSVFIALKDSNIKTLQDIKGKKIAAVAPLGFGGWLIGYSELYDNGIDPVKDKNVEFLGSQKRVINSVLNKKYSVGVIRTGMLEDLSKKGAIDINDFYIINEKSSKYPIKMSTKLYPEWAFASAKHVDSELANSVFKVMNTIKAGDEAAVAGGYTHWHLPENYSDVDELFKKFRLAQYKDMPQYRQEDIIEMTLIVILFSLVVIVFIKYQLTKELKKKLQEEVDIKTEKLNLKNAQLQLIFDLNPQITIITDGKEIQKVNKMFFEFCDYKTLEDFKKDYNCICELFENRDGYLYRQMGDLNWIEYILANPDILHKALIIKNRVEHTFSVHVVIFEDSHNKKYIVTMENVTKIHELASTDKLTQLLNRVKLDEILNVCLAKYKRYKRVFSIIMIDIDYFKSVNDKYGHIVGDSVLVEIANLLKKNSREIDIVGRWGGEEFLIISTETDARGAYVLAENLRKIVEQHTFKIKETQTISLGVACYDETMEIETLINNADKALYKAKETGRNRVCVHEY